MNWTLFIAIVVVFIISAHSWRTARKVRQSDRKVLKLQKSFADQLIEYRVKIGMVNVDITRIAEELDSHDERLSALEENEDVD